jgi:hypothetical protein
MDFTLPDGSPDLDALYDTVRLGTPELRHEVHQEVHQRETSRLQKEADDRAAAAAQRQRDIEALPLRGQIKHHYREQMGLEQVKPDKPRHETVRQTLERTRDEPADRA